MEASQVPSKFSVPFAADAGSSYIRSIPTSQPSPGNGQASLDTGFPPETFTPPGGGGFAPDGRDFNGLLNQITLWSQWQAAGGPITYDATFQSEIGGYPKDAVVQSAVTAGLFWLSTADNNTTNPDTGGAGWVQWGASSNAIVGTCRQLAGSATGGSKTASWSVKEMIVETAVGGIPSRVANQSSLSFNGATTGAGGMDTGNTPISGDLYCYLGLNPLTGAITVFGTVTPDGGNNVYQGSNAPAGYVATALLWSGKTDSSGNILPFLQVDRQISIGTIQVLSAGTSTSLAAVLLSGAVPANARTANGYFAATVPSAQALNLTLSASASSVIGALVFEFGNPTVSTVTDGSAFSGIAIASPQQIGYQLGSSSTPVSIYVTGYAI